MKTVLVTGGTGFLGRHIVRKLLVEGLKVRILDIKSISADFNDKVEFIETNLKSPNSLKGVCQGIDVVFHLAGEKRKKEEYYPVNVLGTENILNEAVSSRVGRFIYLSSVGVTGSGKELYINEDTRCDPSNEYEKSKWEGESLVLKYSAKHQLPVTVLRPTNIFGEEDPETGLLNLIKSVRDNRFCFIGKDSAVVNYIYAGQVAEICLIAAREARKTSHIFQVASPLSLKEFVGIIAKGVNKEIPERSLPLPFAYSIGFLAEAVNKLSSRNLIPINLDRVKALCNKRTYSGKRIEKDLGINLKEGLESGLMNTIRHYQKKGLV